MVYIRTKQFPCPHMYLTPSSISPPPDLTVTGFIYPKLRLCLIPSADNPFLLRFEADESFLLRFEANESFLSGFTQQSP